MLLAQSPVQTPAFQRRRSCFLLQLFAEPEQTSLSNTDRCSDGSDNTPLYRLCPCRLPPRPEKSSQDSDEQEPAKDDLSPASLSYPGRVLDVPVAPDGEHASQEIVNLGIPRFFLVRIPATMLISTRLRCLRRRVALTDRPSNSSPYHSYTSWCSLLDGRQSV